MARLDSEESEERSEEGFGFDWEISFSWCRGISALLIDATSYGDTLFPKSSGCAPMGNCLPTFEFKKGKEENS